MECGVNVRPEACTITPHSTFCSFPDNSAFFLGTGRFRCGESKEAVQVSAALFHIPVGMVIFFAGIDVSAGLFCFFQNSPACFCEGQNTGIGDVCFQHFPGNTQKSTEDHPLDPGAGIAFGFGGSNDVLQGGFCPAGVHELPPQALAAVGERFEFFVSHGPQPGQDSPFTGFQRMKGGIFENGAGGFGDAAFPVVGKEHQIPDGGGGRVFRVGHFSMVAACPVDGENVHGAALGENGLAVFHSQNVVGQGENVCFWPHGGQSGLAGSREGFSGIQMLAEQGRKFGTEKGSGGLHQRFFVGGFGAEAQHITHPGKDPDTFCRKTLSGGEGCRDGKLQYQIRAAEKGGFRPGTLVDDGRHTPLNIIAAHGADNGCFFAELFTNQPDLLQMAQMQGVVFANNTNGHGNIPLLFIKNFQMGLEKSKPIGYNIYKYDYGYHIIKLHE